MRRGVVAGALACALLVSGCSGDRGGSAVVAPTAVTGPTNGSLEPALLTQSQLRRVPGLSTATVVPIPDVGSAFADPAPRGPCGAALEPVSLRNAAGNGWTARPIRSGAQLVVRGSADRLRSYLAARIRNATLGCPPFKISTPSGALQEVRLQDAVAVTREADQSLAVVMAARAADGVRAQTIIEVRLGDLYSRVVLVSSQPLEQAAVRGIASLMAKAAARVS